MEFVNNHTHKYDEEQSSCGCNHNTGEHEHNHEHGHGHDMHETHSHNHDGHSCGCGGHHGEHAHKHEHHGHEAHHEHSCCCTEHTHVHHEHTHDGHSCGCGCEHRHGSSKEMIIQFGLAVIFFITGILFSFVFNNYTVFAFNFFEFKMSALFFIFSWAAAGYTVLFASLKNIVKGKIFDENFLMSIATIGAFCLGEWSEGAAVMLFYNLGEIVQHSAVEKSRKSIIGLMDLRPEFARLYEPDTSHSEDNLVDPASVKIGSLICVKPGEKIPLDGIVTEGISELDTSSMTGESIPRSVRQGEEILAGFVNLTGVLIIRTTKDLQNTAASKMLRLIEEAQNRKARVERFISSFARIYTPIVTISAVLISVLPPIFNALIFSMPIIGFETFSPWISRGLVFLVISCPCAFVISVPLGYFGGIGRAAKRGILIKGADYIDALSRSSAAVFDKTGTLTNGVLSVSQIFPAKQAGSFKTENISSVPRDFGVEKLSLEQQEILRLAVIAEFHSSHPIALALHKFIKEKLSISEYEDLQHTKVADYAEFAGKGVGLSYNEKKLFAGNFEFIKEEAAHIKNDNLQNYDFQSEEIGGGTQVHILYGGEYFGFITLRDTVKTDSKKACAELFSLGIKRIEMLTGDNEVSARYVANGLGIKYSAELLPHQKVERFEQITREVKNADKKSSVIFAGDGINDAPVLARADVGIAMGGTGSDAAIEAADVVLMNDNPRLIAEAVRVSRFTRRIVWQNISLAFFIKIGFLSLGALGIADMWGAVFADVGVALLAVFNSLRAVRK